MEKTSTGLDENVAGLLCYVLGWITGLIFVLIEQENKFVRYHAFQSILVFGILTVVMAIFSLVPVLNWIIGLLALALWIVLMVKAYQGTRYKLPWAGNLAEKWAGLQSE